MTAGKHRGERREDSCSLACDAGFGGTPCDLYPGRHRGEALR